MDVSYTSGGWIDRLPSHIQSEVKAAMVEKHYHDGELIYAMGDSASESYIVDSGNVKLSILTPEGKEYILALMGEGFCFGEQGILDNSERLNSAYAMGEARIRALPKAKLDQLRKRYHEVSEELLLFVNYRLRIILTHVYRLVLSPLKEQLAARIYMFSQTSGIKNDRGIEIQEQLTQEDLAKLTGASRQSINKELKELQKLGVIDLHNKKITVLDLEHLKDAFQII